MTGPGGHVMTLQWFERNQQAVAEALQRGERPDMATTMDSGPLDDLVAVHDELGVFEALDRLSVDRERRGIEDRLLLRTLAVLPFLPTASLTGASSLLFRDPAILLHLGWSAVQIRMGDNERHRSPAGHRRAQSLPCHAETLRGELARIERDAWLDVQRAGVRRLFDKQLVRGGVYAIDGSGLGEGLRLVALVCVSARRPKIVAWRLLEGTASEKGKEAAVTRSLIEQLLEIGGKNCIELLLVDALYADGPLLAWCKYVHGIDVLVPIPKEREIHRDLEQLAAGGLLKFTPHSYVRTIQGHKQRRLVELGSQSGLTGWDSFMASARSCGAVEPWLWACLIRPANPTREDDRPWTLVSTRAWPSGKLAFNAFRSRWHIENDAYRELKEGWGLEAERWGRNPLVQHGRVALTCLAFNTAQVYLDRQGAKVAAKGIRRLRRHYQRQLGAQPTIIFIRPYFAVFPLEDLMSLIGLRPYQSLRPLFVTAHPP
jgi:hypothetical protein